VTPSTACPCGVAVTGIVEANGSPDQAIVVYEQAVFQVLALGA
jgi:hypothetical protein